MRHNWIVVIAIAFLCGSVSDGWSRQVDEKANKGTRDLIDLTPPLKTLTVEETKRIEADKLFMIGYMDERKQSLTAAVENYAKAIKLVPNHLSTLKHLVPLYQAMGRNEEAMELCQRAIKLAPNDPSFLHIFAQQAYQRGEFEAAIDSLKKLIAANDFRMKNPRQFYEACVELNELARTAKDYSSQENALRLMISMVQGPELGALDPQIQRNSGIMLGVIYQSLGECYLADKKPNEAIEVLSKAKSMETPTGRFGILLAEAYFQAGDLANASKELETFRTRRLSDPRPPALLEKILTKQGNKGQLLKTLEEWLADDKSNTQLRKFYSEKLIDAKNYSAARNTIKDEPASQAQREYLPTLARLYREMNDPKELLKLLVASSQNREADPIEPELKALAKNKELFLKMVQLVREGKSGLDDQGINAARVLLAETAREAKLYEVARSFLEQLIQANSIDSTNYLTMASLLWQMDKYEDLQEFCRQAITKFPGEGAFQRDLARSLLMLGRKEEALKVAETWMTKTSDDSSAIFDGLATVIWICERTKQWDKAIQVGENAIKQAQSPQVGEYVRYMLTNVYTLKGDDAKAESELQKLIDTPFGRIQEQVRTAAHNDLGYLWADKNKNLDKAEKYIRYAVARDPDSYSYLDSLGWVLFRKGKYKDAFEILEKANQSQEGSDPTIWEHLGDVHLQLGRAKEAIDCWQKAADLYSKHPRERNDEKYSQVQAKIKLQKTAGRPLPKRPASGAP